MKKHFKYIIAIFIVLLTVVHIVHAQETNQIADKVYTKKAKRLEKELENLHYQRIRKIDEVSPWRVRYNKIRNDLFELRRKELTDGMDSTIADKRKPLDRKLAVLKQKRDSIQNNILLPLAQQRDTLYHQYALEITKKEPMQHIVRQMIHKRDSIDQEVKILYEELTRRGWNNEPRQDISDRILKAKRDSGAYFLHRDFIATLRNEATGRLQLKKSNSKTFQKEMRAIDKVEAALTYLGLPERIRVDWGDSWPYDVDDVNRRELAAVRNNYSRYRDAYLATLPNYMRHVVLRRSNEQLDSIKESRYQNSILLTQQMSDAERDSVLISYVKDPNAPAEFSTEIGATTMEEFLLSPANSREEDIARVFKDSPVYVVTLKKKQPGGDEIKITEQALLQKTLDFIWGAIYQPGSQYQIPAEDTLTYETARRRYQRYGRYAYLSTLSPEVQYALERYRRPKFSLQDFERYQKQIQRQMDMVAEKHDSVLISRIKDPESKDTFVEIKSTTIEQLIAQPQDDREKDVIAVFKGFPIYAVTLNRRVPDGGVIKIAEQAVLQKTMDFLWGRAYLPSRIGYDAASIDTIPYHQIGVWINRYFPSATYLYTLPKDIRYAYLHRKGDVHDATRQEDRLRKNLNWVATMTDAQRDSVIRENREIDSNEQVHIKLVTLNDTTVAELNEQLNSNNKRLTEILNHFRGYPMYVVTHQKELEDGELFTSSIRMIFKETMTTIWRVAWMRGSTR